MSKKRSAAEAIAQDTAARMAAQPADNATDETGADREGDAPPARRPGRPKGRREVYARLTVELDEPRHAALTRLAADRGTSIHSLVLGGIDLITNKPAKNVWD